MNELEHIDRRLDDSIASVNRRMDEMLVLLNERHANEVKAIDSSSVVMEEFRVQLVNMGQIMMSRPEVTVRIEGLTDKINNEIARINERYADLELRLTSRLDLIQGAKTGTVATSYTVYLVLTILVAVAAVTLTIVLR